MNTTKDLTVLDICEELGLHRNTVCRLINAGVIPGYKAGLREWRVTRQQLDAFKQHVGARPKGRPVKNRLENKEGCN